MANLLDPVAYYRASRWLYLHRIPLLPRLIKVWCELVFHCEIPFTAKIGPGFEVAHRGFGIVIHHRAEIGRNVILSPCVTIGGRSRKYDVPRLGDNVFVSFGARILGDLTIGDGAVIGANAVVIRSVPPRSVVAGVPARVIRENVCAAEYVGWTNGSQPELEEMPVDVQTNPSETDSVRVLLFIESLGVGGSEKQCVETAARLARTGYSVTMGCMRDGALSKSRANAAGVPLVVFPVRSLLRPAAILQMARLAIFLRRNRIQVVHANDLYSNLFAIPAAWLARVPVIIACQRDLSHWWWYTPKKRWLLRKIQGLSSWLVVNAQAVRNDVVTKDGFDSSKIRVVYNGIDMEPFMQPQASRDILPGVCPTDRLIVMVANMHVPVKGHSDLIAAAHIVCSRHPEARFLLVGDGEIRPELQAQASTTGLQDSALFLGQRTDIPSILSCCEIAVLASRAEGLPNAVMEYMAAGLPTVATSVGGIPEIIEHGVDGLLVPPNDPAALAKEICRLLEDASLRERLGRSGRESVLAKFDFGNVIRSLEQLYGLPSRVPSVERQTVAVQ